MTIRESRRQELDRLKRALTRFRVNHLDSSMADHWAEIWQAIGGLEGCELQENQIGLGKVAHRDRRIPLEAALMMTSEQIEDNDYAAVMLTDDQITEAAAFAAVTDCMEAVNKAFPDLDEINDIIEHFTLDEDSDCLYHTREPVPSPSVDPGLMAELDRLSSEFVDPIIASRNMPR